MDIAQLTGNNEFVNAHNHLLNCGWEIASFCSHSVLYKNKKERLVIFSECDQLLFKMNSEEAKELTEDNLIRTILF